MYCYCVCYIVLVLISFIVTYLVILNVFVSCIHLSDTSSFHIGVSYRDRAALRSDHWLFVSSRPQIILFPHSSFIMNALAAAAVVINPLTTSFLAQDLPSWSTTSHLDIRTWLQKANQLKLSLNATDEQTIRFIAIKMNCLRSSRKVNELISEAENSHGFNWSQFSSTLITEFEIPIDEFQLEMILQSMSPAPNQSIMAYAKAFENEASRGTQLSNSKLCHIFTSTLPTQSLRDSAAAAFAGARAGGSEPTIQKLASSLAMVRDVQSRTSATAVVSPTQQGIHGQSGPRVTPFARNDHQFRQSPTRFEQRQWSSTPAAPTRTPSDTPATSSQDARKHLPPSGCYKCGSRDHWSRECPRNGPPQHVNRSVNAINHVTREDSTSFITAVVVNGSIKASALIDTGAQSNVICSTVVQRLWPVPVIHQSSRILFGPNQEPLQVVGDCDLAVSLLNYDKLFSVNFTIVSDCANDLILGQPFIKTQVDYIHGPTGSLTFNECALSAQGIAHPSASLTPAPVESTLVTAVQPSPCAVKVDQLQRIPAHSTGAINLLVTGFDTSHQETGFFTPVSDFAVSLGLGFDPFLVLCSGGKLRMPVMNRSPETLLLVNGLVIGSLEHVTVTGEVNIPFGSYTAPVPQQSVVSPTITPVRQQPGIISSIVVGAASVALPVRQHVSAITLVPNQQSAQAPATTVVDSNTQISTRVYIDDMFIFEGSSSDPPRQPALAASNVVASISAASQTSDGLPIYEPGDIVIAATGGLDQDDIDDIPDLVLAPPSATLVVPSRSIFLPHLDYSIPLPESECVPLSDAQFNQFYHLIMAFSHIFGRLLDSTAATSVVQHRIATGSQVPIHIRPYRTPIHLRDALQREIDAMLQAGVIVPSSSPWSASVVMVDKHDGTHRLCVDYRRLNSITVRDSYPLPRIQDILDSLSGSSCVFTTLDLLSGFYQVQVHPDDRHKTAFSTEHGHWEFVRMPFGLCNAPASFQRLMDAVLKDVRHFALCYIDDLVIFSSSVEEHLEHLAMVFNLLVGAGLIIKPSKCQFMRAVIRFLGHEVSAGVVAPDSEKTSSILNWPTPKSRHELQVALGLFNYYRKFVPNFSTIAEPLNFLLRKDNSWSWSPACQSSFELLKTLLTSSPILALPNFTLPFTVHCDASATGLGAVLTQVVNNFERVICYASKSLNAAQRKYSATDRECLAIHWAITHWRVYLLGQRFVVVTDHMALKWLFAANRRDPHHRHDRLILDLQQYDFTVVHRAGSAHADADALSRMAEVLDQQPGTPALTVNVVSRSKTGSLPARAPRVDSEWITRDEDRDLAAAIKASFEESDLSRIQLPWSDNHDDDHKSTSYVPDGTQQSHDDDGRSNFASHPGPSRTGRRSAAVSTPPSQPVSDVPPVDEQSSPDESTGDVTRHINLLLAQREDADLSALMSYLKSGKLPADVYLAQWVRHEATCCRLRDDGVLVNIVPPPGVTPLYFESRVVIPTSLRPLLLAQYHDDSIAGHLGEDKSFNRLSLRYYWAGMRSNVRTYVKSCLSCQKRKTPPHLGSDTIGIPHRSTEPFERISIDVLGPLPLSGRNNRYCLCVIDLFTRFPFIFPIPNQRTTTVATVLIERVFLEHGFALEVLSDRGSNFISTLMNEVMALLAIRRITTLAYSPQTNGVVERFNHSLLTMLSHYITSDQRDWDLWIPYVLFAFRSAPHSVLAHSPFLMLYGREPRFPSDAALSVTGSRAYMTGNEESYLSDVATRLALARDLINRRLDAVDQARSIANSHIAKLRAFEIGDRVLRWQPQLRDPTGKTKKLAAQWEGPYLVVDKKESSNTYTLAKLNAKGKPSSSATTICQADRLKKFYERVPCPSSAPGHVAAIRALSIYAIVACDSSLLNW